MYWMIELSEVTLDEWLSDYNWINPELIEEEKESCDDDK